jgi:hypothetical protein
MPYPNVHTAAIDDDDKNSLLDKLLISGVERSPEDQLRRWVVGSVGMDAVLLTKGSTLDPCYETLD